jgi:heme-degrading monooxygenase HmoA
MIEIVHEFVVKDERRSQFELAYGPGGAWSKLFSRSDGYRGTTVLRDEDNPRRYLVIDIWDTADQRDTALVEQAVDHAGLEASLAEWAESRAELGVFRVHAQSTVRPRGRAGPGTGRVRRGGR